MSVVPPRDAVALVAVARDAVAFGLPCLEVTCLGDLGRRITRWPFKVGKMCTTGIAA